MTGMQRCDVCSLRIDPVAAPTHPSCEPDAEWIRAEHRRWLLRLLGRVLRDPDPRPPRLSRLARHNPDLNEQQ